MPNCWTPIDRSTRANEPYAITGRAKSATLRNLQVASTPRGNTVGPTKMFNLLCFFVVERLARKKKRMWDFCNDSIYLSLLFFFTDGLQVPFESPFSRREVAALKFLPFQRAHLFASGIPIVIREPTVRQSGQHRYVSVNRDSCTHHKNPSRR